MDVSLLLRGGVVCDVSLSHLLVSCRVACDGGDATSGEVPPGAPQFFDWLCDAVQRVVGHMVSVTSAAYALQWFRGVALPAFVALGTALGVQPATTVLRLVVGSPSVRMCAVREGDGALLCSDAGVDAASAR
jgi:hypothetical protein